MCKRLGGQIATLYLVKLEASIADARRNSATRQMDLLVSARCAPNSLSGLPLIRAERVALGFAKLQSLLRRRESEPRVTHQLVVLTR